MRRSPSVLVRQRHSGTSSPYCMSSNSKGFGNIGTCECRSRLPSLSHVSMTTPRMGSPPVVGLAPNKYGKCGAVRTARSHIWGKIKAERFYERSDASSVKNGPRMLSTRRSGCFARAGKKLNPASSPFVRSDTITNQKYGKGETSAP